MVIFQYFPFTGFFIVDEAAMVHWSVFFYQVCFCLWLPRRFSRAVVFLASGLWVSASKMAGLWLLDLSHPLLPPPSPPRSGSMMRRGRPQRVCGCILPWLPRMHRITSCLIQDIYITYDCFYALKGVVSEYMSEKKYSSRLLLRRRPLSLVP
jgi:hypothetical protein